MPKGNLKIWYNMFDQPCLIEVYNGSIKSISDKNLVFSSKGYFPGVYNQAIDFNTTDSVITIKMAGKLPKTNWVCKVYCPRIAIPAVP